VEDLSVQAGRIVGLSSVRQKVVVLATHYKHGCCVVHTE